MKKEELLKTRQYKATLNKFFYVSVPLDWCVRFDLKPLDLMVFCIIADATERCAERAYTGSMKGLCAKVNTSIPTVRASIATLTEKGFIRKVGKRRGNKLIVTYEAMVSKHKPQYEGGMTLEDRLEANKARMALIVNE